MGMTRTEIELLIKARNEAQGAFDNLSKQVTAISGGTDKASDGMERLGRTTKGTGQNIQATSVAAGLLVDRLATGLVRGFNDTIAAANRADAAFGGLSAVAKGFGIDVDAAKQAAIQFASNGLVSVSDAATALKNLLSVGYGLPESMQILQAHADAAAYNRQGMLGFGESIVRVTDGLKFNNSQLTDSTGLGKNLSAVMKDNGLAMDAFGNAVNDADARQAYLNDTLKAAAIFHGNAAKYAETSAGQQAAFGAKAEAAASKIGKELQPAVQATLAVLGPFVEVAGEAAPVLVPLAAAAAGVVGPIAAMRVAATLGIPAIGGLTKEATAMFGVFKGVRTFTDARAGIQLVGEASGITTKNLGTLGSAAAVAGTAFAGWQIGRLIADMTGLDSVMEKFWNRLRGVNQELVVSQIQEETRQRAVAAGAAATISYLDAVQYLMRVEDIRLAKFNQSIDVQRRAVDAELALGRITQQTANERLAALAAEERAQEVERNRISLAESIRIAEKKVQDEIRATGMSVGELTSALRGNADQFKDWAEQNKLSEQTIKFLEDRIKRQTKAAEEDTKAKKEAADKARELRDSLADLGLVTASYVREQLAEMKTQQEAATAAGIPLEAILKAQAPRLKELAEQAKVSNQNVGELAAAMHVLGLVLYRPAPKSLPVLDSVDLSVLNVTKSIKLMDPTISLANNSLKALGITSTTELRRAADETRAHWQNIVALYGEKSPEATAAYKLMIEAQKEASRQLPSVWRDEIFPGISRVVGNITTAVEGSFAQMLLGAKGFKEGFTDIWKSLKAGAINILNEILSEFINRFLKGMLAAMAGQRGAFQSSFAGLFGGGGAGGGFLSGLMGAGGGGGGGMYQFDGLPGVGGATGTAAGLSAAQVAAGSVMGAGVGFGMGRFLGGRYGTFAGAAGGAVSGAATGFMMGGPVGGIIGGTAGLISGIISGGKNTTKEQREQFARELGYRNQEELFAALKEKAPDVADSLRNRALNEIGKKDTGANAKWMEDILLALDQADAKLRAAAESSQRLGLTWEDMNTTAQQSTISKMAEQMLADQKAAEEQGYRHDAVIKRQAASYSELIAKSVEMGLALPEAVKPVLQELMDMGLLLDANGEKITDLSKVTFDSSRKQASAQEEAAGKIAKAQEQLALLTAQYAQAQTDEERNQLKNRMDDLEAFLMEARRQAAKGIEAPVFFSMPDQNEIEWGTWGGRAGRDGVMPIEGGAANGVMADRPGLVLFGEGGETEVGGPMRFFETVFRKLGISGKTGQLSVTLQLHGRTLAKELVPLLPEAGRALGAFGR